MKKLYSVSVVLIAVMLLLTACGPSARNWPRWPHKGTSPGTAAQCRSMTRPAASSSAMHPKFVPPFNFQMIAS